MSTRSAFGTIGVTGHFKGRYTHSDGYPSAMGHQLSNLILRDGVDRVLEVITKEHYGWSYLDFDNEMNIGSDIGDRGVVVEGYGCAFVADEIAEDEWVTHSLKSLEGDDWGAEWLYAINADSRCFEVIVPGRGYVMRIPQSELVTSKEAWKSIGVKAA